MDMHYICTGGCGGTSNTPGVCQTENCPSKGNPLQECTCTDGFHKQGTEQDPEAAEGGDM